MRRFVFLTVASIASACAAPQTPVAPSANPHGSTALQIVGDSFAADLPRVPFGAVRLYGKVIDFPTGIPIPAATATLVDSPTARTQTDATGSYETRALPGAHTAYVNGENAGGIGFKSD